MSRISPALRLILIGYVLCAVLYSVTTPILDASDELWHFATVKAIADTHTLPVQNPAAPGDYRQEGGQPPLYYLIGAVLILPIDTSDFYTVRELNPHADLGLISPDGNANSIVHDASREAFPWHGTVLAVHLLRLLSIALGAITVAATFGLACLLLPDSPISVPIGAALLVAFNPMFLFISASVNNDNLSNALASLLLLQIVRLVRRPDPPRLRTFIGIGVLAGAGLLAKLNIGFLLPLIALALLWNAWQRKSIRPLIVGSAITGGLTILIGGWWYVRNWQLYGDPTGLNVFLQLVGSRAIPADARELWAERHTFLMSFWGFFGSVNIPLPDLLYTIFNVIAAVGVIGAISWLINAIVQSRKRSRKATALRQSATIGRTPPIVRPADRTALAIARAFTLFWILVLFVSLIRWTMTTPASQGRLMFAAIAPIAAWLAIGLWQFGQMIPIVRGRLIGVSVAFFIGAALFSPIVIAARYSPPASVTTALPANSPAATFCEPGSFTSATPDPARDRCFRVTLVGSLPGATPGGYLNVTVQIQPLNGAFTHTWSIFAHLVDPASDRIFAQRDVYPGAGLIDTRRIASNTVAWNNPIALKLPDYTDVTDLTVTPELHFGFYDYATGRRMILIGGSTSDQNEWRIGAVTLMPHPAPLPTIPPLPNPMSLSFADQMTLIGYKISTLSATPGQTVTVTLYWQCPHKLTTDYHVFVHLINPQTTAIYGQNDAMPVNWARPTTTWQTDEVVEDAHTFTIKWDAASDTWPIEVGVYQLGPEGNIARLRIFSPDGSDQTDLVYLGSIHIQKLIPAESF